MRAARPATTWRVPIEAPVKTFAVSEAEDEDAEDLLADGLGDAAVAGADTSDGLLAFGLMGVGRERLFGKGFNPRGALSLDLFGHSGQRRDGSVRHPRRREGGFPPQLC